MTAMTAMTFGPSVAHAGMDRLRNFLQHPG
jgi:hypothetical protein